HGESSIAHLLDDLPIDVENGAVRIGEAIAYRVADDSHLLDQLAHGLGTGTTGSLIGHGRHPLHQPFTEESAEAHQHQAHGTVTANEILAATGQTILDHVQVYRVQHNNGILFHPQCRSRINPVA